MDATPALRLLLTMWLAVTLTFVALRIVPGNAIESQLRQANASPELIAQQSAYFGVDDPLWQQYTRYWGQLLRGDLGISLVTREKVSSLLMDRLAPTVALAGVAFALAVLMGVSLGIGSALDRLSPHTAAYGLHVLCSAWLTLSLAMPIYWTATLAIYLANTQLQFLALPSGGTQGWQSLVLPGLVLGLATSGSIGRITDNSLRTQLQHAYIQTARAKGLPPHRVLGHALRGSAVPILSICGLQAGFLLGGAVIIELMFTRRGLGSLLHQAVLNQDYAVVQALTLLAALVYGVTRFITLALSRLADPRPA